MGNAGSGEDLAAQVARAEALRRHKLAAENKTVPPVLTSLVEAAIARHGMVLYGGTAIHLLLRARGNRVYEDGIFFDYDAYTGDPYAQARELAKEIFDESQSGRVESERMALASAAPGMHLGTFKVRTYGADAADFTYVDPAALALLRRGARVCPTPAGGKVLAANEYVLAASIHHELLDPTGQPERWGKVQGRLGQLARAYRFADLPVARAFNVAPVAEPRGGAHYDPAQTQALLAAVRRAFRGPPGVLLHGHALLQAASGRRYPYETLDLVSDDLYALFSGPAPGPAPPAAPPIAAPAPPAPPAPPVAPPVPPVAPPGALPGAPPGAGPPPTAAQLQAAVAAGRMAPVALLLHQAFAAVPLSAPLRTAMVHNTYTSPVLPSCVEVRATYPLPTGGAADHLILRVHQASFCLPWVPLEDGMAAGTVNLLLYWAYGGLGLNLDAAVALRDQGADFRAWAQLLRVVYDAAGAGASPVVRNEYRNCLGPVHAKSDVMVERAEYQRRAARRRQLNPGLDPLVAECANQKSGGCRYPCVQTPAGCTPFPDLKTYFPGGVQ